MTDLSLPSRPVENYEQGLSALPVKSGPMRFDDFDILDLLGEGSFGRVFRVQRKD